MARPAPGANGLRMPRQMAVEATAVSRPTQVTRERAATVGEGRELPGVSGRMAELTESDSPYIQRARQRGLRHAGRRGLRASSIAAGAAEGAAIDAALPIAQADASIAASERAMRSTEFMQLRDHEVQKLMQQRGFDHDSAQRAADRSLQKFLQARSHEVQQAMQQRDLRVRQLMQGRQLSHAAAQAAANRELQRNLQTSMQEFQAGQRELDRGFAREGREFEAGQRELDRDLAREGRTQDQQLALDAAVRGINSEYQRWVTALQLNTDIPSETRDAMIEQYASLRDQSFDALNRIHDTDIQWDSFRPPPPA